MAGDDERQDAPEDEVQQAPAPDEAAADEARGAPPAGEQAGEQAPAEPKEPRAEGEPPKSESSSFLAVAGGSPDAFKRATRRVDRSQRPMIHLKDIYKAFGTKQVLRGIDLAVYPGETVCIIGGSGTGKSVTLKHIMRLLDPDEGQIWLDGEDITHIHGEELDKARLKLGVNFQFGALLAWLTVFDNVALPLQENTDMTAKQIEERVMSKLELLSIPQARDQFPDQISGGMKKRAGLARAVVMEEHLKVILYDEPTSGLDPISTATVDEMVNEMKDRLGVTQIIVTHDMASAYRTADRIAVLHQGEVVQFGTPEEIQSSSVPYVQQFIRGLSTQEALVTRTTSGRFVRKAVEARRKQGGGA